MTSAVVAGISDDVAHRIHRRAVHFARLVQWSIMDCKGLVPSITGASIVDLEGGPYTPIAAKQLRETVLYLLRSRDSGLLKLSFGLVRERVSIVRRFATSFHGIVAELAEEVLENSKPYASLLERPHGLLKVAVLAGTKNHRHRTFRARAAFEQLRRIGADPHFPGLRELLTQEYEDVCAGRYGDVAAKRLTAREAVARVSVQWHPSGKRKGCVLVSIPGQVDFRVDVRGAGKAVKLIDEVAHRVQRAFLKDAKSSGKAGDLGPVSALPVHLTQAQKTRLLDLFRGILRTDAIERDDLFENRESVMQDGQGDVSLRFRVRPSELGESGFHERAGMVKNPALEDCDPDDSDSGEASE